MTVLRNSPERHPGMETGPTNLNLPNLNSQLELYTDRTYATVLRDTQAGKPTQHISISPISTLSWNSTLIKRKHPPREAQINATQLLPRIGKLGPERHWFASKVTALRRSGTQPILTQAPAPRGLSRPTGHSYHCLR